MIFTGPADSRPISLQTGQRPSYFGFKILNGVPDGLRHFTPNVEHFTILGLLRNGLFSKIAMFPSDSDARFLARRGSAERHEESENGADGAIRNQAIFSRSKAHGMGRLTIGVYWNGL